ncbi:MAG: peptidase, partial [Planctomycetota bacterium]
DWDVVVRGQTSVAGRVVVSTNFVKLRVAEPYLAMQLPTASAVQGSQLEYVVGIEKRTPFEGKAEVKLVGLPPGVTTEPTEIDAQSEQAVFPLKIAPDARPGRHRQLFCQVVLTESGEPILHSVGQGELRIDKPAPADQTASNASSQGGPS